jgi:hypothetical protein
VVRLLPLPACRVLMPRGWLRGARSLMAVIRVMLIRRKARLSRRRRRHRGSHGVSSAWVRRSGGASSRHASRHHLL